ncbi:MAG TPA: VOC family protein [Acidobacteriaceae bacterium]|jgi:catechol 2,3-dioxygenase-like lactoylglutathione lyase family enzyme|nr:VOC family protein [Acidobacteriaceae bacterium]
MAASTAIHLDEIGQITLTVTNLDEARAFYRDTLGMRILFDAGPSPSCSAGRCG